MSALTMPFPHPHTGFHREYPWQEARPSEHSHRHGNEPEKIALPSIRQVIVSPAGGMDSTNEHSPGLP